MCSLGEIVDLSPLGMRVTCQGKCLILPGQMMDLNVAFPHGPVRIKGWIRWVKKSGFLAYEAGIQFVEVAPDVAAVLAATAWTTSSSRERSA